MQNENIYWSCDVFDNEHINPNNQKEYIDPWDLENYAYIQEHLDSVEEDSIESSGGESVDYRYSPRHSRPLPLPNHLMDSLASSEPFTGSYAAIEEVQYGPVPVVEPRGRRRSECYYKTTSCFEADVDSCYIYGRSTVAMPVNMPRERSISCVDLVRYSTGDTEEESSPNLTEISEKDSLNYEPEYYSSNAKKHFAMDRRNFSPIYDDIESHAYMPNMGMSKYGHLQIDYSCNWSNLDKYICH